MAEKAVLILDVDAKSATKNVGDFQGKLNETSEENQKLQGSFKDLFSDMTSGFASAIPGIGALTSAQKALNVAVGGGGVKAFKALKFAIAATGIGAILIAIASLVSFFTRTKRGAELLERAMAGLGAGFDVVVDLLSGFGELIVGAFENPQQAVKDLWEVIKTNIVNRFKGLIDLVINVGTAIKEGLSGNFDEAGEAAKKAGTAFIQLQTGLDEKQQKSFGEAVGKVADEIGREADEAIRLKGILQDLNDQERELNVTRAESTLEIEKLKLAAEDVTKATGDRIDAAQRAFKLEKDITNEQLNLLKTRLSAVQQQNALGESMEEDLQKEADLRVQIAEIEAASFTKRIELNNKINAFNAEAIAKRQAHVDKMNDLQDKLEDARTANIDDEVERNLKSTEIAFDREIEQIRGNSQIEIDLRKELEKRKQDELQKIRDDAAKAKRDKELEDAKKDRDAVLKEAGLDLENDIKALEMKGQLTFDKQRELAERERDLLLQQDGLTAEGRRKIRLDFAKNISDIDKKEKEDQIAREKALAEARVSVSKMTLDTLSTLGDALINNQKANATFQKVLAIGQIAIDTAKAISGAVAQAQVVPFPGNIVAIATGVGAVLSNIAAAITTLKKAPGPDAPGATQSIQSASSGVSRSVPRFQQQNQSVTPTSNNQDSGGGESRDPVKVFVLENDISEKQERANTIKAEAEL